MDRGNSFANGATESGQRTPYRWEAGYQTTRPVTCWDFMEPDGSERC